MTSESSTSRGKINMVYLGTGTGKSTDTLSEQAIPDTSEWTAGATDGTIFWVGLSLSDMKKMDTTASGDPGRTSHFSDYANADAYDWVGAGGIFNIAAGIEYASEYVQAWYMSVTAKMTKSMLDEPAVMKKFRCRTDNNNYTWDVHKVLRLR